MNRQTNMPWAVYRHPRLGLGETPKAENETFISGHLTAHEAKDEADRLKRADRRNTYMVGSAA